MLDKAQQLNTSAREVFEFIACCCSASGKSLVVDSNCSGGNRKVDGRNSSDIPGRSSGGPPSPTQGEKAAGVAEGSPSLAPDSSLSDNELKEGEALLLKIYRCTSAPTNSDDRTVRTRASANVHPGVRHRVEVQTG